MKKKSLGYKIFCGIVIAFMVGSMIYAAVITNSGTVLNSFWSLVPPIIAIVLALITKEVYSSLFIGIVAGGLLASGFSFTGTMEKVFPGGIISVLSDSYNVGILIFLVVLGVLVSLMNRSGGSASFGNWAAKHIKTRVGAQIATIILGILIFIDDYFNCLTVGSVMRPVTDKHKVSRAKLAYLIDATAAPVCIIAPISSWSAAVSGFVPENQNGIALFVKTIPYNYYALLTIAMVFLISITNTNYGPMKLHEYNAEFKNDIYTTPDRPYANQKEENINSKGKVIDLIFPVIILIIFCVLGMLYTGGFFSGASFIEAFSQANASVGLVYGSVLALIISIAFYLIRRVLTFTQCMESFPEGFKAMVSPVLILTFAWSLKAMTETLGAKTYVNVVVDGFAGGFMKFLPAIIFLIAVFLAFATGTSWGTFGILIPIVVSIFDGKDNTMMIIAMSACMAGAVCGDHCSPISDTTIMSSAGAQCNHLNHVTTQLPYAMTCAAVSFVTYIIAGFTKNVYISLISGFVILTAVIFAIKKISDKAAKKEKKTV